MKPRSGDIKVNNTPLDRGKPLGRDFVKHNDAHGKSLTTSAVNALQKMFKVDGNATHVSADGQGKIAVQQKDINGNFIGDPTVYDVKELRSEIAKDTEYHIKRHIISEHTELPLEDLNNLKEINGEYHYKDKNGKSFFFELDDTQIKAIEQDISSLGLDNNKQHVPDYIGKDILEHIADQETKNETVLDKRKILENKIKNGTVYSYEYDQKNEQYKFYIIQEGKNYTNRTGKADGEMMEVTIDRQSLPLQVKNGLEYHERKVAVVNEFSLNEKKLQDLKIIDGKLHFEDVYGKPSVIKPTADEWKNIEAHLAAKGFSNNTQQISDSVGNAALKHAINQEKNPAKKAALEVAMAYDYVYDKINKKHVYHVLTKEAFSDEDKGTQIRDGEMERVSFTADEHKKLLDDATVNAVEKYGELPDGTTVKIDPNDNNKFLVTEPLDDGGKREYTLKGDSILSDKRTLKEAIASELSLKPRVEPDILSEKETLVSPRSSDKLEKSLEQEIEDYGKHTIRILKAFAWFSKLSIQAKQAVGDITAAMGQFQDNSNLQQPQESGMEKLIIERAKKHVLHYKKKLRARIKADERAGILRTEIADNMINSLDNHLKRIHEEFEKSPLFSEKHRKEIFGDGPDDSLSDSASLYSESDDR